MVWFLLILGIGVVLYILYIKGTSSSAPIPKFVEEALSNLSIVEMNAVRDSLINTLAFEPNGIYASDFQRLTDRLNATVEALVAVDCYISKHVYAHPSIAFKVKMRTKYAALANVTPREFRNRVNLKERLDKLSTIRTEFPEEAAVDNEKVSKITTQLVQGFEKY